MNLFDDNDFGSFDGFDGDDNQGDFGFDSSDNGVGNDSNGGFGNSDFDDNSQDFSNSDELLNTGENTDGSGNSGSIKKTAIIMIAVGIVVIIGVLCLARAVLNKDKPNSTVTNTGTSVSTQAPVQQTTVNAQELMGGNNTQTKPVQSNSNNVSQSYDNNYWINIDGADQIVFGETTAVQFHITDIKHYIANVEGSDNYVVKSTLKGSLAGYSGTFQLDIPYAKGTLLQVGQEFTAYITVGSWNGKTVIGEIKY